MQVRSFLDVEARSVSWLWPWRLAAGNLAMLEGDPGLGKSLLTLDLCARLSTGRPWPDGSPSPGPANALILNGEDCAEDTVRARLAALGADMSRVFLLDGEDADDTDHLQLPSGAALLEQAVAQTRARLVILDPLMDFLDAAVNVNSETSVRRALRPLVELARQQGVSLVLLRHLNKGVGGKAVYRGMSSIAFGAKGRSTWLVGADPQAPNRRVLAQVKNNMAPDQPSLAFEIVASPEGTPTISWLGTCAWSADQLMGRSPAAAPASSASERAKEFLLAFLADGPRTCHEVWAAAQQEGLSERTLNRVKPELQIESARVWINGAPRSYWLLQGQKKPESAPPEEAPPNLEKWLAPLRERFPPPTPLDDK
jgi:hypothetical protein